MSILRSLSRAPRVDLVRRVLDNETSIVNRCLAWPLVARILIWEQAFRPLDLCRRNPLLWYSQAIINHATCLFRSALIAMVVALRLVVVHHKDFPIRVLWVAIWPISIVSRLWLLGLSIVIWSFEQLDIFHVPGILGLDLALVKVLTVHAVSTVFILVHVGVCCIISLKLWLPHAVARGHVSISVTTCTVTRLLSIGWELVAPCMETWATAESLRVSPPLGNHKTLRHWLS